MPFISRYPSPLGNITLAGEGDFLTGLWFDGQKYFGSTLTGTEEEKNLPVFSQTAKWLSVYFEGKVPGFTPPLKLKGTGFSRSVWDILLSIPYGQTMSYGEIAGSIAEKRGLKHMSAQAVGGAVAHNPISVIVPCHRVVGANGSLTGYAGGIEKKIGLLTIEKADMRKLSVPKKGTAL